MTPQDLKRASTVYNNLTQAQQQLDALSNQRVIGIIVGRPADTIDGITIRRGHGCGGTGTINSIGWSQDMEVALSAALLDVFRARKVSLESDLQRLGIELPSAK